MTPPPADFSRSPLPSSLANDPNVQDLVKLFIAEMPGRIKFANDAFIRGDRLRLQFWAHQLKGCAGGYGFAQITHEASALEEAIIRNESTNNVFAALLRVFELCERTTLE